MKNKKSIKFDKLSLVYGYLYRCAQEAKEDGLFAELSLNEVIGILIENMCNEKSK